MEQWYVLYTEKGREVEAVRLVQKKIPPLMYSACRILKKKKVFRSGGVLHILEEVMFPGYLFIKTDSPEQLSDALRRARSFPQMIEGARNSLVPVESEDLRFLKGVCGEELERPMEVTKIRMGADNQVVSAEGILNQYLDRIVKWNLHKRFAVVDVELFHRRQEILFALSLEKDRVG